MLDKRYKHDIAVVVDRLVMRHDVRKRLADSIETAVGLADGLVEIEIVGGAPAVRPPPTVTTAEGADGRGGDGRRARMRPARRGRARRRSRSRRAWSPSRGRSSRSPSASHARSTGPRWSSSSRGSSRSTRRTAPASAAPGSARRWRSTRSWSCPTRRCRSTRARSRRGRAAAPTTTSSSTEAIAEHYDVDLDAPWEELDQDAARRVPLRHRRRAGAGHLPQPLRPPALLRDPLRGHRRQPRAPLPRDRLRVHAREDRGVHVAAGVPGRATARACGRSRARCSSPGTRIEDFTALSARRALEWLEEVELSETDRHVARLILREISERLQFLENVGIGYLSMDRAAATLSGGEAQRIRLATQIGSLARRRALHPRRALDRPAPARQLEADRDARAPARPRQHGDRRRARRADDARRRPPRRPRPRRGRARRADRRAGHGGGGAARQGLADRPVPLGRAARSTCRPSGARRAATSRSSAPPSTTCATSTCTSRWAC